MTRAKHHGDTHSMPLPSLRDLRESRHRFASEQPPAPGRRKRWWHRFEAKGRTRPIIAEDVQ